MDTIETYRQRILDALLPCGAKRIGIFGSFARGEQTPESDLDILVELKSPEERPPLGLRWYGIESELSELIGRPVELVSAPYIKPYLRESIEKDLVLIYDEK